MAVDELQKCLNNCEAIFDAQQDAKSFRTHCHDILQVSQELKVKVEKVQAERPELGKGEDARVMFRNLNNALEEAVTLIRTCEKMGQIQKLMDQGETKRKLLAVYDAIKTEAPKVVAFITKTDSSSQPALMKSLSGDGPHGALTLL